MPKYSKADIRHTIRDEEFEKIIKKMIRAKDRLFLSLLYCTGARPSEVAGDPQRKLRGMTFDDLEFDFDQGYIIFHVPVSKIKDGSYAVDKRKLKLTFNPENPDFPVVALLQSFNDRIAIERHLPVSYTHLTLPTN